MAAEWVAETGVLCIDLPPIPSLDDICFPGDFCLSHIWDGINKIPHAADIPLQFFGQIGPAMSALKPLFDVIDFALAIFKCFEAVGDAIMKLDPTKIFECMPALVQVINKLLALIPQLSVPRMVRQLLIALAQLLEGIGSDLRYLQSQINRILSAIDRAADLGDVTLNNFLICAQATVRDSTLSTAEALKGIGRLILLINIFMGLFGGPEIPCFGTLMEDYLDEGFDAIIELLSMMAALLREIANMIPDPIYQITLLLGDQRC